jgi:hypothetical protein
MHARPSVAPPSACRIDSRRASAALLVRMERLSYLVKVYDQQFVGYFKGADVL